MKQILVELPADLAERLERVAPARSRRRSQFIRMAIQRALWELEERATREAYLASPAAAESWPETEWAAWSRARPKASRRTRRG